VLPPGEFSGMIQEPLPVYSEINDWIGLKNCFSVRNVTKTNMATKLFKATNTGD